MSSDLREGLDALQGDMAQHQRMFRGEVTAEANRELAVSEIEKLERMMDEAPAPTVADAAQTSDTREVDGRKYRFDRSAVDDVKFREATEDEANTVRKVTTRLELLLSKEELGSYGNGFLPEFVRGQFRMSGTPASALSWRDRVMAVMSWKIAARQPGNAPWRDELEKVHGAMLIDLMNDSIAHFGDWKKDPEPTISVGA